MAESVARVIPLRPEETRPVGSPSGKPRSLTEAERKQGHACGWVSTCSHPAFMWFPELPGSDTEVGACRKHLTTVKPVQELRRMIEERAKHQAEVDKVDKQIVKLVRKEHVRPNGLPVAEMARLLGKKTRNGVYNMLGKDF